MKTILLIICNLIICGQMYTQNIINTLGTSGTFTIKSSSTNFLTLSQSTGNTIFLRNLELGNQQISALTIGVLTKGGTRFLHNFAPAGTDGNNTFLGINAGNFTMTGTNPSSSHNTCIGAFSLFSNVSGYENTALGNNTLYSNTSGNQNTAVGYLAMSSNNTGGDNTAIGYESLSANTTGGSNTALGFQSLFSNISGYQNTALGKYSMSLNTYGNDNTAVGLLSLTQNTLGNFNVALGNHSLYSNSTGEYNTALGSSSLNNNTIGDLNTAVGSQSLYSNTTASNNTAFSYQSLFTNTTGNSNTAIGYQSLFSNTTASENTALGYQSMYANTTGYDNTALGKYSLNSNTIGFLNTALGFSTGSTVTTGSNLTMIGYNSEPSSPTAVNQVTLGDGSVSTLRCNVQTITSLSDKRDKKNINDLTLGLDFIAKLKPRQFNWDKREWYDDNISDGSKMQEIPTAGFIAQELDEAQTTENAEWLNLVLKDNPEKLEATYGNLLPVMVKAIQELKTENDTLKAQVENLVKTQNVLVNEIEKIKEQNTSGSFQNINITKK